MGTQLVLASHYQAHRRIWRRLIQTARLCCGIPDYDNYVRHMLEKHPDKPVMDYPAFLPRAPGCALWRQEWVSLLLIGDG